MDEKATLGITICILVCVLARFLRVFNKVDTEPLETSEFYILEDGEIIHQDEFLW